jgi:hypothetical protein
LISESVTCVTDKPPVVSQGLYCPQDRAGTGTVALFGGDAGRERSVARAAFREVF